MHVDVNESHLREAIFCFFLFFPVKSLGLSLAAALPLPFPSGSVRVRRHYTAAYARVSPLSSNDHCTLLQISCKIDHYVAFHHCLMREISPSSRFHTQYPVRASGVARAGTATSSSARFCSSSSSERCGRWKFGSRLFYQHN